VSARAAVLVTAEALAAELAGPAPPRLIAVRAAPAAPDALRIAGAVDAVLATDFAAEGGGLCGSRPLPDIAALQAAARRWGLRAGERVVLYDHDRALLAARGWWTMRWAGLAQVRVLDGGFAAWERAGLPVVHAAPTPAPGDVTLSPGHMPVLDEAAAARLAREGLLLDTRVRVNHIAGHIPGAVSAPAADVLREDGSFAEEAILRHLFAALGADRIRPLGTSCGAGVSAAHGALALAAIGIEAALHVGSWSAWSADPSRPVIVGGLPG
jgi:thiosulfate/3-mercaptopyruvate sulfurtransferase